MATTTDLILLQYLDILEKTNQQLGLWSDSQSSYYGFLVASLSFLVVIVIGFFVIRQLNVDKEIRKYRDEIKRQKEIAESEVKKYYKMHQIK